MKRWGTILLVLSAIALGAFFAFHTREPSHHGKRLNTWLDDLILLDASSQSGVSPAISNYRQTIETALSAIGTNGVPLIIHRLATQDDERHKRYRAWWLKSPSILKRFIRLSPQMTDRTAAYALYLAGPEAIPVLATALQHPNPVVHMAAIGALNQFSFFNSNHVIPVIPLITPALTDSNVMVRLYAAGILGRCGPAASNAVPALTLALQDSDTDANSKPGQRTAVRAWSATALGKIGPAAKSAVPGLKSLLQDPDGYLRPQAAVAIWRIDADVDTALPVLLRELPKSDPNSKWEWLAALGEMGPRAKESVPLLLSEFKDATTINRSHIIAALQKIDPEAAANLVK